MLGAYPQDQDHIIGGPEAVVMSLLTQFAQRDDMALHMITCRSGLPAYKRQVMRPSQKPASNDKWTVHYLPRKRWGRLTQHIRERRMIVDLLHTLQPEIVHAHATGLYAAAAFDAGTPAVLTVHGIGYREAQIRQGTAERLRGLLDSRFERQCIRRATHMISISPYVSQIFARDTQAQIWTIENPIDARFFDIKGYGDTERILFVGRIIARKGIDYLLRAFREIAPQYPEAALRLAGEITSEPNYVDEMQRVVTQSGLDDRVDFLGSLSKAELFREYEACAMLVLPSRQETAPVVIEEAMAAGRPVIGTRVGGVPYLLQQEHTGLLIDDGDVSGLARAMARLLANPAWAAQLGQAAQQQAWKRFRPSSIAEKTRDVYQTILSSKK
jgi:glycosyltransferase involved in cell wall biosynthesis